ncbi:MAG: sensor domain-containing diguanylate cyclase [Syntrophorhabdaceae bacterium]
MGPAESFLDDQFYLKVLDNLYEGLYIVDKERKIIYWNEAAEKMTGYARDEVVGKHCWEDILMHTDDSGQYMCKSECLLKDAMEKGDKIEAELFFHHREGHHVPVLVRVAPIYDRRGRIAGAAEIFSDNYSGLNLGRKIRELERMALLDPLTKLGNRRYGEMNLSGKLRELKRYGWQFGVLFIDIDNFKVINDTYGHPVGDKVLRLIATTLTNGLRSSDIVSRWGGEEFVACVANVDGTTLFHVAEKLRMLVEKSSFPLDRANSHVTISIGATIAKKKDSANTIIKRADSLMYASKKAGRNRTIIEKMDEKTKSLNT